MIRALFTAAREDVACPRCGAAKSAFCVSPKGRRADTPHRERLSALARERPQALKEAEVKGYNFGEFRRIVGL